MQTPKRMIHFAVVAAVTATAGMVLTLNSVERVEAQSDTAIKKAIAVIVPTDGNKVSGQVTFTQTDGGVRIEAHLTGLTPNQEHGFHVHQYGDISGADGKSAGGHFNPKGADHAGPAKDMRHVGDLGNIKADSKGQAKYDRVDEHASLDMANASSIIGRGVVVHGGTDDMKSQPSGAAGPRIAYGVIGVANPE